MFKISKAGLQAGVKKLSTQLMLLLLIVGIVAFIVMYVWQSVQIKAMQAEYQQKLVAYAAVQERNGLLQDHLDFYNSPGYMLYVEKVAREALGMVRPGDTVILTVPDKNPGGSASPGSPKSGSEVAQVTTHHKPSWQNWLSFFWGH
ncbi:MAG: septum formation initiator family protein [Chloroflexi bacterium]|nr:septum formation initiator family protein [Chloroflexota bacterium]